MKCQMLTKLTQQILLLCSVLGLESACVFYTVDIFKTLGQWGYIKVGVRHLLANVKVRVMGALC